MTRVRTGTVALAVLCLAGSACNRDEPRETTKQSEAATPNDATITMTVQSRYFGDDTVKAHQIDVDTDNGLVKLSGTVESEAARSRAETIAQSVSGVTRVQNDLRVAPEPAAQTTDASRRAGEPARPDADRTTPDAGDQVNAGWITTKIQAQYFADADVKGRNIDVTTGPDGTVTLAGHVETDAERQEAIRIARTTEGVRNVESQLTLASDATTARAEGDTKAPAANRPDTNNALGDSWITVKVESKYFLDDEVKGRKIDVTTENGIVTLEGEVESAGQRRQAVLLAQSTEGVKDVRDQLKVVTPPADDAPKAADRSTTTAVNDEWIEAKIQSKYFLADDLKTDDIKVSSTRGVVTLQGRVENADEKRVAEEIAKETDGVRNVVNRIDIATPRGTR